MDSAQKERARKLLYKLSSPDEQNDLNTLELSEVRKKYHDLGDALKREMNNQLQGFSMEMRSALSGNSKKGDVESALKSLVSELKDTMSNVFTDTFDKMSKLHVSNISALANMNQETNKIFLKHLKDLKGSFDSQDFNKNAGPLFKTMINELSGMNTRMGAWKFPQYSAVSVRNKNFSNIDPAQNDIAGTISDGTKTITTSGTAVQLTSTSTPCYAVYVQSHESNSGTVVVGSSTVVAALSGRRGFALYPTNPQKFIVSDVNMLWIDSTVNGDKVNFYVEKA